MMTASRVAEKSRLLEMLGTLDSVRIAAVIPAYRVETTVAEVVRSLPGFIRPVIVVVDGSPDGTERVVRELGSIDERLEIIAHDRNLGVGAAMITGFRRALERAADIVVKVDGDGQMPVDRLPDLLEPLIHGQADMTKGNRFHDFSALNLMPLVRRIGNTALGFLVKASTGYWNLFDPTNGFLAVRTEVLRRIPIESLDSRYFFEISLLGRFYLAQAVVQDVPVPARYRGERSSLSIPGVLFQFPPKLLEVLLRRIVLKYGLYDFSLVSLYLIMGIPMTLFGLVFGGYNWIWYSRRSIPAPTGTVMLAALPVILGFQLLLSATAEDLRSVPSRPLCTPLLESVGAPGPAREGSLMAPRANSSSERQTD